MNRKMKRISTEFLAYQGSEKYPLKFCYRLKRLIELQFLWIGVLKQSALQVGTGNLILHPN